MNSKNATVVEDILNDKKFEKDDNPNIFEDEDLMIDYNMFDEENAPNTEFNMSNNDDNHIFVSNSAEANHGCDSDERDEKSGDIEIVKTGENIQRLLDEIAREEAPEEQYSQNIAHKKEDEQKSVQKDIQQQKQEQQEKEDRKYGKFKTPEELLHAYGELEKEFTRRSQRLKELENARNEPFKSDDDWKNAVDKFFEETPSAKVFAKDIANEIIAHPELKQDKNCLNVALTRTLVSKFRTPEQLMSDGQFLKDYVLCSKEVKDAVIKEYLQGIKAGEPPFVLGGGGLQFASSPKPPKTIEEAGFMFLKENK